jgi:pimeloyl-ACP methyl ester carboxylesterase
MLAAAFAPSAAGAGKKGRAVSSCPLATGLGVVEISQVVRAGERIGMLRPENPFVSVQRPAKERFSLPVRGALGYYRNSLFGLNSASFQFRSMFRANIDVPTLALRGEHDQCIPDVAWEQISVRRFRKEISLNVVQNASHFPQLENPDAVNELLIRWLSEHENEPRSQQAYAV